MFQTVYGLLSYSIKGRFSVARSILTVEKLDEQIGGKVLVFDDLK